VSGAARCLAGQRSEAVTPGRVGRAGLRRCAARRAPTLYYRRFDGGHGVPRLRFARNREGRIVAFPGHVASALDCGAEAVWLSSCTFSCCTGVLFYGTHGDAHPRFFSPAHRRSPVAQAARSELSSQRAGCPCPCPRHHRAAGDCPIPPRSRPRQHSLRVDEVEGLLYWPLAEVSAYFSTLCESMRSKVLADHCRLHGVSSISALSASR